MTVFVILLLPVLVSLGFWQLDRAALKRGYEAHYFDRMAEPAGPMPDSLADSEFQRVRLAGRFDPERYFLVDNQIQEGRPGYWVVAVFIGDDGREWLVNRGWTAAASRREDLPALAVPQERMDISGVLWPDTGLVPLLAEDSWPAEWPKRVQRLDVVKMAAAAAGRPPAIELRLEGGQPGVLVPAALGHDFKVNTHNGYAAQWFGLAVVLTLGYVIFGLRRDE